MSELKKIVAQIALVLILSAGVAFFTNAARDDRLPWVMPFPPTFQCPSSELSGLPMDLQTALRLYGKAGTVFVDARKNDAFQTGHIQGARHIPYSFVRPVSKEALESLGDFKSVIVYCNTKDLEASKLLAGELAQAGISRVTYLEEGLAGWVKAGGRYTGKAPQTYDE